MQQNDISITITQAQEEAILTKADELIALIDAFAVSLTDEERAAIFKLGDARMAFDQKCDNYMHQRSDLVPPGVNLPEYDKDGAAIGSVKRMRAKVGTIDTRLGDTQMVLGGDRLNTDLTFYNYLGFASRTGAAGADDIHDDLKTSLPGRRATRTPSTPPGPTP